MRFNHPSSWVAFAAGVVLTGAVFVIGSEAIAKTAGRSATVIREKSACTKQPKSKAAKIIRLAAGNNAFVGKLHLKANGKVPPHRDATEEIIHVVSGGGTISIDDVSHAIGPGDTVYMPANAHVHYQNGPKELVAIQVFAGPGPAAKYDSWESIRGCK